jgi:hypothetical protein
LRFGYKRSPVHSNPRSVALTELGHCGGDSLIGVTQNFPSGLCQLDIIGSSYGAFYVRNQTGYDWWQVTITTGVNQRPDTVVQLAKLIQPGAGQR